MKKLLFLAMSGVFASTAMGQFFDVVSYKGAFAPYPAAAWTDGWANFDPQNENYPAATVTVNSNITSNTTWTSNNVYLLDDAFIYVTNNATLTIQPGTIIRGTGKGTLIIERGSKIIAQGTAANPIVFTSNAPAGSRDYGDWGGVVICGHAQHNSPAGTNALTEGGIGDLATGRGLHGGNNDADSSGVMTYVRIEFPGISLTAQSNSEINGLSMYSVGSKTVMHHIQVSYSGDDSFEWFGGTVNGKYLYAFRGWDDDFDTDLGYRGNVQFAVANRDPEVADQSGSNGFESDNDGSGTTNTPQTAPVFHNVTIIGPVYAGAPTMHPDYKRALHIRRNSATSVFNSIFAGYPDAGLLLDSRRTVANYCGSDLKFEGNILAGNKNQFKLASNSDTLCIANVAAMNGLLIADNDTLATANEVELIDAFNNNLALRDLRPLGTWSNQEVAVNNTLSVFPNPASSSISVELNENSKIEIIDITGKLVYSSNNAQAGMHSIDVNAFAKGTYAIRISNQASVQTAKFIKN